MPVLMDLFSMPKISVGDKVNFNQENGRDRGNEFSKLFASSRLCERLYDSKANLTILTNVDRS